MCIYSQLVYTKLSLSFKCRMKMAVYLFFIATSKFNSIIDKFFLSLFVLIGTATFNMFLMTFFSILALVHYFLWQKINLINVNYQFYLLFFFRQIHLILAKSHAPQTNQWKNFRLTSDHHIKYNANSTFNKISLNSFI